MSHRFLPNTSPPYTGQQHVEGQSDAVWGEAQRQLSELERAVPVTADRIPDSRGRPKRDPTVYTGLGGVAYLYFHMYMALKRGQRHGEAAQALQKCWQRLEICLQQLPPSDDMVAFYCSNSGILALSAAVLHAQGADAQAQAYMAKLLDMAPVCAHPGVVGWVREVRRSDEGTGDWGLPHYCPLPEPLRLGFPNFHEPTLPPSLLPSHRGPQGTGR